MNPVGQRKCCHCKQFFVPDPRHRKRQHYCVAPECRRTSKGASQARWLCRPENRDYFRGPENVERVRAWRAANPGYGQRSRRKQAALQETAVDLDETAVAQGRRIRPSDDPSQRA